MDSNFGHILKELREKRGLTVNQLAIYSEVSPALISKLENGKRGVPKPKTLEKISKGLKMDYSELMKLAGYKETINTTDYVKETGPGYLVRTNPELADEILREFDRLPTEDQEYIADLIKRMKKMK